MKIIKPELTEERYVSFSKNATQYDLNQIRGGLVPYKGMIKGYLHNDEGEPEALIIEGGQLKLPFQPLNEKDYNSLKNIFLKDNRQSGKKDITNDDVFIDEMIRLCLEPLEKDISYEDIFLGKIVDVYFGSKKGKQYISAISRTVKEDPKRYSLR